MKITKDQQSTNDTNGD